MNISFLAKVFAERLPLMAIVWKIMV